MSTSIDVVIIGAGPAGSTAAALLARAGHRVVVLEKDEFPRFHIGESLLPIGVAVHEKIGLPHPDRTFLYKAGAQFICEQTQRHATFSFDEALDGPPRHAWHVERAAFDTLIRDRALAAGADVRHGERVIDVNIDETQVRVQTASGEVKARYLVDATGQDRLIALRRRAVSPFREFGKAAVFCHFHGLSDAACEEIGPGAEIRIMMVPSGWAWFIPLTGRRLSVGIVSKETGISTDLLRDYIPRSPLLSRWVEGTERTEPQIIRNFSYRNQASYGARYGCIGDAACFLDPVFSSGVALAMVSASRLAERLGPALANGREHEPDLLAPANAEMERGYNTFGSLIGRFYNTRFADNFFFGNTLNNEMRRGVISVLAGDVWREDNPFQALLLSAKRRPVGC